MKHTQSKSYMARRIKTLEERVVKLKSGIKSVELFSKIDAIQLKRQARKIEKLSKVLADAQSFEMIHTEVFEQIQHLLEVCSNKNMGEEFEVAHKAIDNLMPIMWKKAYKTGMLY